MPDLPARPLPRRADVVVVGAGLAGLACALRLHAQQVDVVVVEAADGVGGRVRTDRVDGFRLDRGFQLLNPYYPEVRRLVDLPALGLQPLPAGVVVASGGGRRFLADPRRTSVTEWPRVLADLPRTGVLRELPGFGRWALRAARADTAELLSAPDEPWGRALDRRGLTGPLRHGVLEPFLAGVLAERDGTTSRRFVELLLRSFVRGRPSLPRAGMQALPDQLAAGLPAGVVHLGVQVTAVAGGPEGRQVATAGGTITARAVVVAADPDGTAALTGLPVPAMHGLTTFWHVAEVPPTASGALHVDADHRGPVVNSVVISHGAPSYRSDARSLVATTVLGATGDQATETAVRHQLALVHGTSTAGWGLLATHAIPRALTAMPAPLVARQPVELGDGLFVAGDHRDTASQQGALVSGRRAADAVLRHLGHTVPPRPPLEVSGAR